MLPYKPTCCHRPHIGDIQANSRNDSINLSILSYLSVVLLIGSKVVVTRLRCQTCTSFDVGIHVCTNVHARNNSLKSASCMYLFVVVNIYAHMIMHSYRNGNWYRIIESWGANRFRVWICGNVTDNGFRGLVPAAIGNLRSLTFL